MRTKPLLMLCLIGLICLGGCGQMALRQKERQMELVARDWSMTIRASQVVPVYPLNQDLQPGDVFLVKRTVADQSKRFRERGFLPTDLRLVRLFPNNYDQHYRARTNTGATNPADPRLVLPRDWRGATSPASPWDEFPRAGFPSYTFDVSNSGGLSVAVPVQAVPVGLSLTGAASATGSITLSDAYTYGLDASSMYDLLLEAKDAGKLQRGVPSDPAEVWYLRVVTQVFAAKTFDVVLKANSSLGGRLDVGARQEIPEAGGQLENGQSIPEINAQLDAVKRLTDAAGNVLPGGSLRATFASGRTIGFRETFSEPIAVGYHGFDVAINSDGEIGDIIPTFQVLDSNQIPTVPTAVTKSDSSYLALLTLLGQLSDDDATRALTLASRQNPALRDNFAREIAASPGSPLRAWRRAASTWSSDVNGRRELQAWLSAGIREAME